MLATAAALAGTVIVGFAPPSSAITEAGATPLQLATALAADPGVISGASYVTVPPQGTPNAVMTTPLAGFPTSGASYTLLTTGNAALADQPNTSPSSGASLGGANIRGNTDYDVTVLKVDLNVPLNTNCLVGVDFRFLSEEYPEYVGTPFNDAFIAELDKSTWTTSGSSINAPDNFAFDPQGNPITINAAGVTSISAEQAAGTTYDGATPLLTAAVPITPGLHALYLSIFDQGDQVLDSAVMLDNLRLGTVANVATDCKPGATPVAAKPRYVALGDSYSSGEGNPPFVLGTDQNADLSKGVPENHCHRSSASYVSLLGGHEGVPPVENWACAGAQIPNLYHGQSNEAPQLDKIASPGHSDPSVKLVTVTIGGNDAGFDTVLGSCIKPAGPRACSNYDKNVRQAIDTLRAGRPQLCFPSLPCVPPVPSLHETYQQILSRAPDARVIVVGYPHLFPSSPSLTCQVGSTFAGTGVTPLPLFFTRPDMLWMNSMSDLLNATVASEVAKADPSGSHITFVPVVKAFSGHEACTTSPWIRGAKVDYWKFNSWASVFVWGGGGSPWSFHPLADGHKAYCRAIRTVIGGSPASCG